MRLVLVDSAPLTFGGGYERFLRDLCASAPAKEHEVVAVAPTWTIASLISYATTGRPLPRPGAVQDFPVEHVSCGPIEFVRILRSADLVYVKNEPHELLAVLACRPASAKVVVGMHSAVGPQPGRRTGGARARMYRSKAYRRSLRRADGFHTLTPESTDWVRRAAGLKVQDDRIGEVPNGVDLSAFPARPLLQGRPLRVLFVGRLVEQKGVDVLLSAVEILAERGFSDRFRLTVVGDGPLRRLLTKGGPSPVEHLPAQPSSTMSALYAMHHVVVMPSRWETFGLVAAEAMATGRPVVLTDIAAFDPFEDGGVWRAVAGSPHSLAEAVISAIEVWEDQPNELVERGAKGRSFVERSCDSVQQRRRLFEFLEATVAGSGGR